jgi:hypothetical protein
MGLELGWPYVFGGVFYGAIFALIDSMPTAIQKCCCRLPTYSLAVLDSAPVS